jgi:hypothetical protein
LILSPLLVTNHFVQAVGGCHQIIFLQHHKTLHFLFQEKNGASLEEVNM